MKAAVRCRRAADGDQDSLEDTATLHRSYWQTRDARLRERLLLIHAGLARSLARRFKRPAHDLDDLTQVAYLGLIKAVDGFEPERGLQFSTYASATILGELKRHLRDQTWGIRPSRRVHDLYLAVEQTLDLLAQTLGRSPTVEEIANELDVSSEDVLEAMDAASGRWLPSLDTPVADGQSLAESVGDEDQGLRNVERSVMLSTLLKHVQERDEVVLRMRFGQGMTQREIARALGRSQMHVSRALARGLGRLRAIAGPDASARSVLID